MRLITLAIHTYKHAHRLKALLEREGIEATLQNVNLDNPVVSSGMRVRIRECDLPLALRIIENPEIFTGIEPDAEGNEQQRTILVPIDFSRHSFNAAVVAVGVANKLDAEVRLLHAYLDPMVAGKMQLTDSLTYELSDPATRHKLIEEARHNMTRFISALKENMKSGKLAPVKIDYSIVEGVPEDAIAQTVKHNPPLLLVMGTRSYERKEREMVGSVTAEVLDSARVSVLVIPEGATPRAIGNDQRMLYFANVEQQDILALDTCFRLFPQLRARTVLVEVPSKRRFSQHAESLRNIADYFTRTHEGSQFDIATNDMATVLEADDFASSYDLLVIPNKKKNIFSRVFNPSLAHRMITTSTIPMLIVPV